MCESASARFCVCVCVRSIRDGGGSGGGVRG